MPRIGVPPLIEYAIPVLPPDALMTVEDVSRHLRVTAKSVYNWINDGSLPAVRIGRNVIRIRKSDVDALLVPVRED
jgi:excisionase family DNA binding protein